MLTAHHRTRLATVTLGAAALAVVGAPAATSAAPSSTVAHQAISTILTTPDTPASAAVPADFTARFGYRPQVRDGLLGVPDGDCSSPVPLPEEFTPACRQHDLGYDLLRYADATGEPLPASARRALDAQLAAQTRAACRQRPSGARRATCSAWASVTDAAVRFNTWRQRAGVPGAESPRSLLAAGGMTVAGVGTIALALLGLRRKGAL
jgi:hypothetical protein